MVIPGQGRSSRAEVAATVAQRPWPNGLAVGDDRTDVVPREPGALKMIVTLVSVLAIGFAAILVSATVLGLVLRYQTRRDGPEPESDDWGGGNLPIPPRVPPGSGDGEPFWWPDFEREFADYVVRSRAGSRRS
jgi:hypothetical protein